MALQEHGDADLGGSAVVRDGKGVEQTSGKRKKETGMRFFFFLVILRYSHSHSLFSLPASLSVRFKQQHFLRVSFFLDGWMDGWTDGLWLGCILCIP